MPRDNVGLVRAGFEAFAQGDIETVLRLCDEDILVTQPSEMPDAAPLPRGHAGVLENIAAWPEQFDDYRIEILRTVEIVDHVVVTVHQTGRGKSTGIPVETQATMVFAIRAGKIAEWRVFLEEDEAFDAVGLRESQENVELVRRAFESFNARDVDRFVSLWDPDCEFRPFRAQLEGITYRGHQGVRRFVSDLDEDWSEYRIYPLNFHERDEAVVVVGRLRALGRGSGAQVDSPAGFVIELRGGLITRVTSHSDPEAALQATEPKRANRAAGSGE